MLLPTSLFVVVGIVSSVLTTGQPKGTSDPGSPGNAVPSVAIPISMAVMGDSLNLQEQVYGKSWVYQLQEAGSIVPFNQSTDGATSDTVILHQLPTVLSLAQQGVIVDSALVVGGNDLYSAALNIVNGTDPTPRLNHIVDNIEYILSAVEAANPNVHQVVANLPDITVTPLVQVLGKLYGVTDAQIEEGRNYIQLANAQIEQFALSHGIPVFDLFTAGDVLTSQLPLNFGGVTVSNIFASNGFDISTLPGGIFANAMTTAFNLKYGQEIPLLTDQQIVTNAGLTPNSETTYYDVRPFVIVPEVSSLWLGFLGLVGMLFVLKKRLVNAPH